VAEVLHWGANNVFFLARINGHFLYGKLHCNINLLSISELLRRSKRVKCPSELMVLVCVCVCVWGGVGGV